MATEDAQPAGWVRNDKGEIVALEVDGKVRQVSMPAEDRAKSTKR